jgi:hypothetical protein
LIRKLIATATKTLNKTSTKKMPLCVNKRCSPRVSLFLSFSFIFQ